MKVVETLKQNLIEREINGIALDIDDTIAHTSKHWGDTLSRNFGNPENLTAQEIFAKYRRFEAYPHWNNEETKAWMRWARLDNDLQIKMPLIENANHFVNKINTIVPVAAYITARPVEVLSGTKIWLEKHGFPKEQIIMAPEFLDHADSSKWKAEVLVDLYPHILAIVDDNSRLIDYLPEDYKGFVFIYNHPNYEPTRKNVFSCLTWEDVEREIRKNIKSS